MSYSFQSFEKTFSNGAVSNTTAPTFSGLVSVTPNSDGSALLTWALATGSAATPVSYRVYVSPGTVSAAALFVNANLTLTSKALTTQCSAFVLGDGVTYFAKGQTYTFGVRAVSAENVSDTNSVVVSTLITGVNLSTVLTDVDAIKAQTDQMLFDGSSYIKANAEVTVDDTNIAAIKKNTDLIPALL